jgi:hypothetical protein
MTMLQTTPEADVRWAAWLVKGRAQEARTRHKAWIVAVGFGIAGALSIATLLLMR